MVQYGATIAALQAVRDAADAALAEAQAAASAPVDPPPVDPPAGFFPPSIALGTSDAPVQDAGSYRIWHNGGAKTGVSCNCFDESQMLQWTNRNGDWLDADGVRQGPKPWYSVNVPKLTAGEFRIDVTALATRWRAVANRGALINVPKTTNQSAWATIAGTLSATPPRIELTAADGTITTLPGIMGLIVLASDTAKSPTQNSDSSLSSKLSRQSRMLLHFPGVESAPAFNAAAIVLTVTASDDAYPLGLDFYETDAPPLLMGGAGMKPTMGLAAEVGSEDALAAHPDVWAAGDFREANWNYTPGAWTDQSLTGGAFNKPAGLFSAAWMTKPQYDKTRVVPDPEYPGRFALATCIPTGNIGGGEMLFSLPAKADMTDPKRPMLAANVVDELYVRVEVYLDRDSFWSTFYAFKFSPVGQDLRMGLWDDLAGWSSKGGSAYQFGNGQTSADGKKSFDAQYQQWMYKGHSVRGHMIGWPHPTFAAYKDSIGLGFAPSHLGPYDGFWDGGVFGTEQNMRMYLREPDGHKRQHVIPKGRWVTMESRVKLNTIDLSAPDANGNGIARNDGILQVWMDGVLCGERTSIAWRCHPEMTIKGNWLMQYHGGNTPTDHDIVIWYRNFVAAKRYIGPAVRG